MKEVLDSRFFVLHYGSSDDAILAKTTAKLAHLRRERRGIIPSIVVAETTNFVCREAGRQEARAHIRAMEHSGLEIVPVDAALAIEAGMLRCVHRDLPLADCLIAATALRAAGAVVSDDPHFSRVKNLRTTWI